mmetsp:Transcript_7600/g.13726  ORF Transcript_7600/g.13726 Transcript_7600/m.13726 type:complete len:91 (+) Transcript_7600:222-494(+)
MWIWRYYSMASIGPDVEGNSLRNTLRPCCIQSHFGVADCGNRPMIPSQQFSYKMRWTLLQGSLHSRRRRYRYATQKTYYASQCVPLLTQM